MIHLFLCVFLLTLSAKADIEVAFLEKKMPSGQRVQLEPGGRFFHVAIAVEGGWLHVHPRRGVEITQDLSDLGQITETLILKGPKNISAKEYGKFLGQPYDFRFQWSSTKAQYCSKLVAQLLAIQPLPMNFSAPIWKNSAIPLPKGELGLSPDEVFSALKIRGYETLPSWARCERAFDF